MRIHVPVNEVQLKWIQREKSNISSLTLHLFSPRKIKKSYWILKYFCIEVVLIVLTENLLHPDTHCEIPHPDVGKYFKEFTGQYYVMNSEKAQEYPDDDVKTRTTVEGRGQ